MIILRSLIITIQCFRLFSFFKKRQLPQHADLSALGADMHSHLIPGIDDGSPDLETSLGLIRGLAGLGYRKIITTPHIMGELYPNNADNILRGMKLVQEALTRENIGIEFSAAAEYMLDDHFSTILENEEPLLTISGKMVLVEFSFVSAPMGFKEKIFSLQIRGYQPILAHPERYGYFLSNRKIYDELRQMGCLFQLNLLSLIGYYGKPAREVAHFLLKKGYVSLLGTDLHHQKHLGQLYHPELTIQVARIMQNDNLLNPQL